MRNWNIGVHAALLATAFFALPAAALAADTGVDIFEWTCADPALRIVYTRHRKPVYPEPKSNGTLTRDGATTPLLVEKRNKNGWWATPTDKRSPGVYLLALDGTISFGTRAQTQKLCAGKLTTSAP